MGMMTTVLIAIGLSMDAFAVSVSCGLSIKKEVFKNAFYAGLAFGVFQWGMTMGGWLAGYSFRNYIEPFDHWVAFGLLLVIGLKMIKESRDEECVVILTGYRTLITLAIATSIDALAAGISLSTLKIGILVPSLYIGVITFAFSFAGVYIGKAIGCSTRFKSSIDILGGVILIGIGVKILLEHLVLT